MIEKMSKSDIKKLKKIVKINNHFNKFVWKFKPNVVVHFGEIDLYEKKHQSKDDAPIVTVAIDRVNNSWGKKGYLVSSTTFYCDFSKIDIHLLLPIQRLIREINISMCTPVHKKNK